jgi:hypothetical protein
VDVESEREVVADPGRRQPYLDDVVRHAVLQTAVQERLDLDRQGAPDLAGIVESQ